MRSLSFGGCGWALAWSLGVARGLARLRPAELDRFSGASGGALVAATLALGINQRDALDAMRAAAQGLSRRGTSAFGRTGDVLERILEDLLPADAHERLRGSALLTVSVTMLRPYSLPRSWLVSDFGASREDLKQALLASCYLPEYTRRGSRSTMFRGARCVDGGLTNNTPLLDDHTFLISPFPSVPGLLHPYDVCPFPTPTHSGRPSGLSFTAVARCAFHPEEAVLVDLFECGEHAAQDFLRASPARPAWRLQ